MLRFVKRVAFFKINLFEMGWFHPK
jgi:hypothetical protein